MCTFQAILWDRFGGIYFWELVIRSTRISETDLVFEISFYIRLKPFFTLPLTVKSRNNTFFIKNVTENFCRAISIQFVRLISSLRPDVPDDLGISISTTYNRG